MLLYQCGIFIALCGISISFELPHDKDGPHGAVSEANLQLGQERAKHNQAIEAKGDSDGFEFKKEIQVPIKIYKPPSVNNENDDGVIKRLKRKTHKKAAKVSTQTGKGKKSLNNKKLCIGVGAIILLIIICMCGALCMKG